MSKNPTHRHIEGIRFEIIESASSNILLDEITKLSKTLFEKQPSRDYFNCLQSVSMPIIVCARTQNSTLIGSKIGYRVSPDVFYSWVGGVHPDYRRIGIARELMSIQHAWCSDRQIRIIRTKSLISNISMYTLNINSGYSVIGNDFSGHSGPKLIFSKLLPIIQPNCL
jgi:ribosomal protein S18 acetylase RimI-like enzyme